MKAISLATLTDVIPAKLWRASSEASA